GAADILDDHRPTDVFRDSIGHDAADCIGRTAGCEWNDERNWARGVVLREGGANIRKGEGDGDKQGLHHARLLVCSTYSKVALRISPLPKRQGTLLPCQKLRPHCKPRPKAAFPRRLPARCCA